MFCFFKVIFAFLKTVFIRTYFIRTYFHGGKLRTFQSYGPFGEFFKINFAITNIEEKNFVEDFEIIKN